MNKDFLAELGLKTDNHGTSTGLQELPGTDYIESYSPVDGELIGRVSVTSREQYGQVMSAAKSAFKTWRLLPAPKRGEIVRQYGNALRKHKDALGRLVS